MLRGERGSRAKEYLDKRQISGETCKNFGLGYAPTRGEELLAYLHQKGFTDDLIRDVGLAKIDERRGTTTQFLEQGYVSNTRYQPSRDRVWRSYYGQ